MGFLDFFVGEKKTQVQRYSKLYNILCEEYPSMEESDLVITSCISGLLARVAYVDFKLDQSEVEKMKEVLGQWNFKMAIDTKKVTEIAVKHIKEMAGLENHLYVHPLNKHLSQDDKFKVLQALFLVAASDGEVESLESEEIRLVTKGLELSNQHFISARAEVVEFLKALK